MSSSSLPWICCQLGARENYAVARAMHSAEMLDGLITDIWTRPGSLLSWVPMPNLRQRYSAELGDISVRAANWSFLVSEYWRRKTLGGYELFLSSNAWFQRFAHRALEHQQKKLGEGPFVVFRSEEHRVGKEC